MLKIVDVERLKIDLDCKVDFGSFDNRMMVLNAIDEEPLVAISEDCISRKQVEELGATCIAKRNEDDCLIAIAAIDTLPTVVPLKEVPVGLVKFNKDQLREICEERINIETERKHGKWITWERNGRYGASCSECGKDANYFITPVGIPVWSRDNYCPCCGVDMREEENND